MQSVSETVRSHGLDGTWVEPDWQPLSLDEARAVLRHFPRAGEPRAILTVSPRPFSAASVVETGAGRVFLKRHARAVRDYEGLAEEHRFLAHLGARGLPVPAVLRTELGATALEEAESTYEVHQVPEGVDLYADVLSWTPFLSANHAHEAGRMLARLHRCAAEFQAPRRAARPLVASFTIFAGADPAAEFARYAAARPALRACELAHEAFREAAALLAPFYAELRPRMSALKPLWTHNDLHGSNLMWSGASDAARAVAVIDFGLADRTCAVHDIAHAIERSIPEWLALVPGHEDACEIPVHFDHLELLLDGYESVRPLSAAERAALAPMTALCHAEFALTEADYFRGVLRSEDKTRVALVDYLVGHARWYARGQGSKLLNAIRRWSATRASKTKVKSE